MKEFSKEEIDEMCLIKNKLLKCMDDNNTDLISLDYFCTLICEKQIPNLCARYSIYDLEGIVRIVLVDFYYHKTIETTTVTHGRYSTSGFILSKKVKSVLIENTTVNLQN